MLPLEGYFGAREEFLVRTRQMIIGERSRHTILACAIRVSKMAFELIWRFSRNVKSISSVVSTGD